MTAPTPERRVGEAELAEIVAMEWDGLRPDELRRNLARDLLDERAANARLTAEVERLREAGETFLYAVEGEGITEIPSRFTRLVFGNALKPAPYGRCRNCEAPRPAETALVASIECPCGTVTFLSLPTTAPEARK